MLVMAQLTGPSAKNLEEVPLWLKYHLRRGSNSSRYVDLYMDGGVLFCKYCEHSIDYVRIYIYIDTIKDHLKSKKHASRKEAKLAKCQ